VARPTKLTAQLQEKVVQAIRAGNYAEIACRAAGISPSSYYRWMERGEQDPGTIYAGFAEAVRLAEAESEVHAVALVRRAMSDDWRAALAYLERRHPARWRRHSSTELTGRNGGPVRSEQRLDLSGLTDEDLTLVQQIYERAATGEGQEPA
jgi:transposase